MDLLLGLLYLSFKSYWTSLPLCLAACSRCPPSLILDREHGSAAQADEGLLVPSPKMRRPS